MMSKKHDVESLGSNPRDHAHPRRRYWKHAHKDWRIWVAATLMIALILVYVLTDNLSMIPGRPQTAPMPESNAP